MPFGIDIELTNWPNAGDETGERVQIRAGYELTRHTVLQVVSSYQAMSGAEHGLGGGARLQFRF